MKTSLIFALLLTISTFSLSAAPLSKQDKLSPDVTFGELSNGLRYYLKPNENIQSGGDVELRMLVNSGSIDEGETERGIAHLIEHMAFRRTKHFAPHEIKDFLNSNGLRLVNDSNAMTSYETTTFMLKVTTKSLDRALQLLADWANGDIEFDPTELQLERQIVLDEKHLRTNDGNWRDYLSILYPDSVYLDRSPIGNEASINGLPLEKIQALYRKLYQPQKISIIATGDLPDDTQLKIKKLFSQSARGDALPQATSQVLTPKIRLYKGIPPWPQRDLAVSWTYKLAPDSDDTKQQLQSIAMYCLQQRLQKMSVKGDVFSAAQSIDLTGMVGRERVLTIYAVAKNADVDAIRALYREIHRAKLHGFSVDEVNAAQQDFMKQAMGWAQTPAQWANSLVDTARFGTHTLGNVYGPMWFRALTINAETVNHAWQELNATPDQIGMQLNTVTSKFDQEQLETMVNSVKAEELAPFTKSSNKVLMSIAPPRGSIKKTQTVDDAQFITLSNGAQVMLRYRRQTNERIGISALFQGGMLGLPKAQHVAGLILPSYHQISGLGDLTWQELSLALSATDMQLNSWVGIDQHGFSGSSNNVSLIAAMQVIHQFMSYVPNSTEDTAKQACNIAKSSYWKNGGPGLNKNIFGSEWPYQAWTSDEFQLNKAQLEQVHTQLFGDPSKLKLVITGVTDAHETIDLLERYIASIPQSKMSAPLLAIKPMNKQSGLDPTQFKARFTHWTIAVDGVKPNTQNVFMAEALTDLLKQRLWQVLREDKGDSYVVDTGYDLSTALGLLIYIDHSSDEKSCQDALPRVAKELKRIANLPVSDVELKGMREYMQKGLDNGPNVPYWYAKSQNFHWNTNTSTQWLKPDPIKILSREQVDAATKSWFVSSNWSVAAAYCQPNIAALTADTNATK